MKHGIISQRKQIHCQWNMNKNDDIGQPRTIEKEGKIRFGFIGNINVLKGTDILIEACKDLATTDWSLTVAGTGKEDFLTYLKSMAPDNVDFIGWTSAPDFYKSIDMLVCPSTYHDPLPRVVYEAYREGLPVVASDTGGNPEYVDHEKTGFLYPAKSVHKLTDILDLCTLLSPDEYNAMSKEALKKAKLFTPKAILKEYKEKVL
jgi:glycosyltransferase involved in cell wall biosynthesis